LNRSAQYRVLRRIGNVRPQVASELYKVLMMNPLEVKLRHDAVTAYVREHTSRLWSLRLLTELQQIPRKLAESKLELPTLKSQFGRLFSFLQQSDHRLFFFDYDASYLGRIKPGKTSLLAGQTTRLARPTADFMQLLEGLAMDPRNTILLRSRRSTVGMGIRVAGSVGGRLGEVRASAAIEPLIRRRRWRRGLATFGLYWQRRTAATFAGRAMIRSRKSAPPGARKRVPLINSPGVPPSTRVGWLLQRPQPRRLRWGVGWGAL
jgi:hypothetical protein